MNCAGCAPSSGLAQPALSSLGGDFVNNAPAPLHDALLRPLDGCGRGHAATARKTRRTAATHERTDDCAHAARGEWRWRRSRRAPITSGPQLRSKVTALQCHRCPPQASKVYCAMPVMPHLPTNVRMPFVAWYCGATVTVTA